MLRPCYISCVLVFCLLATVSTIAQQPGETGTLIKVTDRVYTATGYALANVIYVITDSSVVVIDTTESQRAARETLDAFRKVSTLPVSHIIYTHFHGDHVHGAKVFKGENTKVVAQADLVTEMAKFNMLRGYNHRVSYYQFGIALPQEKRGIRLSEDLSATLAFVSGAESAVRDDGSPPVLWESGYIPPDISFDEEYSFEEGGVRFELYHTQGETVDHLMVWMPRERVLFPGDLFYDSFPMLASPMKPNRPVRKWIESLERMRRLRPAYLVPSHGPALEGEAEIDETLANYAEAIRYVHDETVKRINKGMTLEQIREQVRLPDDLAPLPYLQPRYGHVEWAINGIYRQYTGWYDFNPSHLNPGSISEFHRALLEASGGADPIVERAQQALHDGDLQLVLQLTDVVLDAEPDNRAAHAVRAKAFGKLGDAAVNGVERNIYLTAAQEHSTATGN